MHIGGRFTIEPVVILRHLVFDVLVSYGRGVRGQVPRGCLCHINSQHITQNALFNRKVAHALEGLTDTQRLCTLKTPCTVSGPDHVGRAFHDVRLRHMPRDDLECFPPPSQHARHVHYSVDAVVMHQTRRIYIQTEVVIHRRVENDNRQVRADQYVN